MLRIDLAVFVEHDGAVHSFGRIFKRHHPENPQILQLSFGVIPNKSPSCYKGKNFLLNFSECRGFEVGKLEDLSLLSRLGHDHTCVLLIHLDQCIENSLSIFVHKHDPTNLFKV